MNLGILDAREGNNEKARERLSLACNQPGQRHDADWFTAKYNLGLLLEHEVSQNEDDEYYSDRERLVRNEHYKPVERLVQKAKTLETSWDPASSSCIRAAGLYRNAADMKVWAISRGGSVSRLSETASLWYEEAGCLLDYHGYRYDLLEFQRILKAAQLMKRAAEYTWLMFLSRSVIIKNLFSQRADKMRNMAEALYTPMPDQTSWLRAKLLDIKFKLLSHFNQIPRLIFHESIGLINSLINLSYGLEKQKFGDHEAANYVNWVKTYLKQANDLLEEEDLSFVQQSGDPLFQALAHFRELNDVIRQIRNYETLPPPQVWKRKRYPEDQKYKNNEFIKTRSSYVKSIQSSAAIPYARLHYRAGFRYYAEWWLRFEGALETTSTITARDHFELARFYAVRANAEEATNFRKIALDELTQALQMEPNLRDLALREKDFQEWHNAEDWIMVMNINRKRSET